MKILIEAARKINEALEYFCSHKSYDHIAKVKGKVNKVMYLYHLMVQMVKVAY